MNKLSKFATVAALLFVNQLAFADGGSYSSHDSINSGSAAATAGTHVYNATMKPKTPLPVHGGDDAVVRQALRNAGSGQSPRKAWSNAAMSESGASNTDKPKRP